MFVHLHVHSHYSVLDGMSTIPGLVNKAVKLGMPALALTDHGNMFGVKEFLDYVHKNNETPDKPHIKPIVGCEVYVARRTRHDRDKDLTEQVGNKTVIIDRGGEHLIVLAKNLTGYRNLCKMVSLAWIEGFYQHPRVDKELLEQYHEGLIVCSACLGGEIHKKIQKKDLQGAEDAVLWYKKVFGDDYYIELQLHPKGKPGGATDTYEQQRIQNVDLLNIARKTNTKIIVSNDVHFVEEEHADAHDRLICLSTGKDLDAPDRMRYSKQEWFKSEEEMRSLFPDLPEAFDNTVEIAGKVEEYSIAADAIMPTFAIPADFAVEEDYRNRFTEADLRTEFGDEKVDKIGIDKVLRLKLESDYLMHLTMEGARKRYKEPFAPELEQRIQFELDTIKNMGFPGYFLIVADFIQAARDMGGIVGPGRGSAAGSVVAYCLKITNIDPLKYDLLFERFLNPDRISLPDIDIDFDDDVRGKVLEYVTQKYGKDKVAHIITFGTMATKSAIKDVARVQKVPLQEADRLVKNIPAFKIGEDENGADIKTSIPNCIKYISEVKEAYNSPNPLISSTIKYAEMLEGTVRQTGMHACGVIIGADDLINHVPLATLEDKDSKERMVVTQYEGTMVEDVGLIKMDFLGLTTLSLIKDAVRNIQQSQGVAIDIDNIPLDDKATYELFGKGWTVGIFQFESAGMRKHLKQLKPTQLEDLIAMNALYRPGPMEYIEHYINRKHGREPISYPFPQMESRLKDTYGITVYQEQVMLLSRDLAGFTGGQSDTLRKAMGKKNKKVMDKLQMQFMEGAEKQGFTDRAKVEQIWSDWEAFAKYAFNKSHSTCYAMLAYQTAYLKAHYPSEFMAAALGRSLSDTTAVAKFMEESKSLKIKVLQPDVNESNPTFNVNKKGDIRFGLAAIKGVGTYAANMIMEEREKNGKFTTIFNFMERLQLHSINKKVVEALAGAGAFDSLGVPRPSFFVETDKNHTFADVLIRYGSAMQEEKDSSQQSLFGGDAQTNMLKTPDIPIVAEFSQMEILNKEKELIGIYLSSHPLDNYKSVIKAYVNAYFSDLQDVNSLKLSTVIVAGRVNRVQQLTSKKGNLYGKITMEDYSGTRDWTLFGREYDEYFAKFKEGEYYMLAAAVQEKSQGSSYAMMGLSPQEQQPKEKELKFKKLESLDVVKKRGFRSIKIKLPVEKITESFIAELSAIVNNDNAKNDIDLLMQLECDGMQIESKATKCKAFFDDTLSEFLEENEIKYQVR